MVGKDRSTEQWRPPISIIFIVKIVAVMFGQRDYQHWATLYSNLPVTLDHSDSTDVVGMMLTPNLTFYFMITASQPQE